jgi:sugar O-acyltransferase (sialic acid O-acetyltransferase NeuD family)
MKPLVVFGTAGFAQVARVYFEQDSEYDVIAFTVDERYIADTALDGLPVVPFERLAESHPPGECALFVAIGFSGVNRARTEVYERGKALGYDLATYVCSKATTWGELEIGDNSFVFEANVIQPFARIGSNVVLWSGNHIGHHSTIEDHCFIASHVVVSGNVTIGRSSFVGVNATFRDGVTVGSECVIGAGALIMKDAPAGSVFSIRGDEPRDTKSWELKNF